ncbi:MAG TPA: hypothetical protein VNZ58_00945 [Thermomicrobiales bacterium]|nr:hypothetical protein [Thermomicrobiales bacterium]
MDRLKRCLLLVVVTLIGCAPVMAQTPEAATPESGPGIQVVVLADSAAVPATLEDETPVPAVVPLDHRLARITMRPGLAFHTGSAMQSALVYVERGSVVLAGAERIGVVSVGDGMPILAAGSEDVVCERDVCEVAPGQQVVLGPGNSFSLVEDALIVEATGDEEAVITMSAVLMANDRPLCWICPTM